MRPAHHYLFYAPPHCLREDRIHFPGDESSHMISSLRLGTGEVVSATDGAGRLITAELEEADRKRAIARVISIEEYPRPRVALTLFQGVIRPQRLDLIIEKCVELGVDRIVPVLTERSAGRNTAGRVERWRKIAAEAMKQSLRVYMPEVGLPTEFAAASETAAGYDRLLVAHEEGDAEPLSPVDVRMEKGRIGLFIGPEGGFSESEALRLSEHGARVFGLGSARLKSETAAIASVALIRHFLA